MATSDYIFSTPKSGQELPEHRMLPRARHELIAYPQVYDHQTFWVVKDPISLRYYRFNREEYFIIQQLQRGVTLAQLKEAHRQEFRTDCLTNAEVADFVRTLMNKNIINLDRPDRDEVLYGLSRKRWRQKLTAQFSNFLFFKIPIFDPDRVLTRLWGRLRFIWTWWFFALYLMLGGVALALVVRNWSDFSAMFARHFFTMYNIPVLMLVIWLIKGFHEFGHGLTCKNYGGEVHEMGWLFLVFAPFFYCNVTDSWTFPKKRHRLLVTAGGIMTEIFFASLAAIVWYFTQPPDFINLLAFNIVVACSVQTVLFNANPLLRYDGYYMFMDLIEIPNLRQRASDYMRNLFVRYILGGHPDESIEEHRYRAMFPIYAIAAYVYRWFIMIFIMYFLYRLLDAAHLAWLGQIMVVFSVGTMLIMPMVKGGKLIASQRARLGISHARLVLVLALIGALAAVALFWPMSQHVTLNFVLEPQGLQWVRTGAEGALGWSDFVQPGAVVDPCDAERAVLARLTNLDLEQDIRVADAQIRQIDIQIESLARRNMNPEVEALRERRAALVRNRSRLQELADALEVRAETAGHIIATREELDHAADRFVNRGRPLMMLADTSRYVAKVWVDERTWGRIFRQSDQTGQEAELMLYAFPGQTFSGRVAGRPSQRAQTGMGEFDEMLALSHKVGGEVVTEYDPLLDRERPVEPVYEITVELDDAEVLHLARPYMSGRIRIHSGQLTLFQWGRESLLRFISPAVRL